MWCFLTLTLIGSEHPSWIVIRWCCVTWRGMVVRYASLKQVARAIMMQKYYFVLSKHLNVWKLVKHFSRQHANHVSQESMTIRIRVLSTRCYDHVARQSLQLCLRRHFRAWYDVSVRLQELAMEIQRSKACCLNRHLKSWRQCLCRRAGVLLALAHLSSSLLMTNEQQNKERLHSSVSLGNELACSSSAPALAAYSHSASVARR